MRGLDLTGRTFGRLKVLRHAGINKWGNYLWECQCSCGRLHTVSSGKLVKGKSTSCGCYAKELHVKQLTKHGITVNGKPRLFTIWCGIKSRCLNPKSINYHRYGKRGIGICEEWLCFESFYNWSIENGYKEGLTIDRIDNNGNYSPDNCSWITRYENALKQERYTMLIINGKTKPLSTIAREIGMSRYSLRAIYNKHGKEYTQLFINKFLNNEKMQNNSCSQTMAFKG